MKSIKSCTFLKHGDSNTLKINFIRPLNSQEGATLLFKIIFPATITPKLRTLLIQS